MANKDQILRFLIDVLGDENLVSLTKAMTDAGKAGATAEPEVKALTDQLNALLDQSAGVKNLISLKAAYADVGTQLGVAKKASDDLNASFGAAGPQTQKQTNALNAANKAITDLVTRQNSLAVQVTKQSGALEKAGVDTTNLAKAQADLSDKSQGTAQELNKTVTAAKAVGDAHQEAGKKAKEAGTAFQFVKDHLIELISAATAVELAMKAIEFGTEGVKDAAQVEQSLSRVKALAGDTATSFAEMQDAIEKAAQAVNVDSGVAASALAALASSGLNAKDAIDALTPTLQLAKIAQIDVATAAQEVASTLKAFNTPASEAQAVVDQLAAASHGAAGGLAAMTNAAAQLAPDAKAIGLSLSQTIDVLGFLQSKGLDAEKSLRGLRTVFQELQDPSSQLRSDLRALGDDSSNFGDAIIALTKNTPQAQATLLKLDGVGRTIVQTFSQAGPDALAKFQEALGNTNGKAQGLVDILDANLNGAIARFKNAFKDIGEALGKPILQPLQNELNALALKLREVTESENFKKIQADIGEFAQKSLDALDDFIDHVDWEGFGNRAEAAFGQAADAATQFGKVAVGVASVFNNLGKLSDVLLAAGGNSSFLVESLFKVDDAGKKVAGTFDNVHSKVILLKESFRNVQSAIQDGVISFENVESSIKNVSTAAFESNAQIVAVQQNMLKLGLSAEQAGQGVTKAGEDMINSFTAIATSSKSSAEQVQLAFAQALSKAQTQGEVEQLKTVLQAAFNAGKISAENYAIAIGAAARKTADLIAGGIDASASLDGIGDAGVRSAQKLITALDAARRAAILDADELRDALSNAIAIGANPTAIAKLTGALDAQQAKIDAYTAKIAAAQAKLDGTTKSTQKFTQAQQDGTSVGEQYSQELEKAGERTNDLGQRVKALADAHRDATSSTQDQQVAVEGLSQSLEENGGIAQELANAMKGARQEFEAISPVAAAAFDKIVAGALEAQGILKEVNTTTEVTTFTLKQLQDEANADFGGGGFTKYFLALEEATQRTRQAIADQRQDITNQAANFQAFANSAGSSLDQITQKLGVNANGLQALDERLKNGTFDAGLLGQEDLGPLQNAVESAIAKVKALQDAAKAADDQFKSLAQSVHDNLLQAQGDEKALEDERHANTVAELQAAKDAGSTSDAAFQKAISDENALHALKMKNIADQAAAQSAASKPSSPPPSPAPSPNTPSPSPSGGAVSVAPNVTITANIYGGSSNDFKSFVQVVKQELDRIGLLSK